MTPLRGDAAGIPIGRIVQEQRLWLLPLGLVLLANVLILVLGVFPLSRSVAASEARARTSARTLTTAQQEFTRAEITRDSQTTASRDLETFYRDVLPADFGEARRITHVKLAQMATSHNVEYQRMTATPEAEDKSQLERLAVVMGLTGRYEDVRAFLSDLERADDFVVVENIALEEGETDRTLTLTLTVSTYYYPDPDGR